MKRPDLIQLADGKYKKIRKWRNTIAISCIVVLITLVLVVYEL